MALGNIAVIGAGMAGLTAAAQLARAGLDVAVFDKGRKPGGRLATRRQEGWRFNHGCQHFTLRDPQFRSQMAALGAVPWPQAGAERFVLPPDMATLGEALAAALPQTAQSRHVTALTALTARGDGWEIAFRDGDSQGFDTVVLAIPPVQAAALLAPSGHGFLHRLGSVIMAPCWAVMLGFDAATGPDTLRPGAGALAWIARENSRPGQAAARPGFTLHASPEWSRAHLEDSPDEVLAALVPEFRALTGITAPAAYAAAHRWRYALAETPLGEPFLWDPEARLGLCGDWCLGGRLEAAFCSGAALGIRLAP